MFGRICNYRVYLAINESIWPNFIRKSHFVQRFFPRFHILGEARFFKDS